MLRAALVLALALAGTACNAPAPAPAAKPEAAPAAKPAPPAKAEPAPAPAPAAKARDPLCDAAAAPLAALRAHQGAAPVAYTDTPLQAWVKASDAATGRHDDAAIAAVLVDTSPAGFAFLRARIEGSIAQWMRDRLKHAAEDKEGRDAAWAAARCAWEVALKPLAAEVAGAEPGLAEEIDAAFAAGEAALASGDPTAIDKALLPGHELVEKSWFRLAHRRLTSALAEAKEKADPVPLARARGVFEDLRDRLKDRNTPGIAVVDRALAAAPDKVDADTIEREIALALVKRARKYCDEALTPAAKGPLGSAAAMATAAEGVAYTRVVLPDMSEKLKDQGFDATAHLQAWQGYGEAVAEGDADEAKRLSAELVQWNCAYQRALAIRECTSSADEVSAKAP
ncbi:hypothetical protein [Nannocystis pusilla]|uniref:hypothetical protein n=1 Tax=Nannocystis pusilla TaxID=889268 RepID=UPI003DA46C97